MGRRGEHGLVPEERMSESTGIRGRVVRGWGRGRKGSSGAFEYLTPTPLDTHWAPGVHEQSLES